MVKTDEEKNKIGGHAVRIQDSIKHRRKGLQDLRLGKDILALTPKS